MFFTSASISCTGKCHVTNVTSSLRYALPLRRLKRKVIELFQKAALFNRRILVYFKIFKRVANYVVEKTFEIRF